MSFKLIRYYCDSFLFVAAEFSPPLLKSTASGILVREALIGY